MKQVKINFLKIIINQSHIYHYSGASNPEMGILANFLQMEVGSFPLAYKELFYEKRIFISAHGLRLEKENEFITFRRLYYDKDYLYHPELAITSEQFEQILNDWQEKVVNLQPRKVIINYEKDQFLFETSFEWRGVKFVKLIVTPPCTSYSYDDASDIEMTILGHLLASDIGCSLRSNKRPTFKDWALDDYLGDCLSSNLTRLEKEGNYIFLTDIYSDEEIPTEFKISRQQFAKLFDDWQEKVCKLMPKEVTITYENDEFIIETKD